MKDKNKMKIRNEDLQIEFPVGQLIKNDISVK